jgi:hypothetical protein
MSEKGIKVLVDRKSLPSLKFLNLNFYKYCVFGKQCRQKFKTGRHITKGILDYIHSYVWGPYTKVYFGGLSYFVTFIYHYCRNFWVYIIKRNINVFNNFKQFRALVQKSIDRSIKCLRTDNMEIVKTIARKLGWKDIRPQIILLSKMVLMNA